MICRGAWHGSGARLLNSAPASTTLRYWLKNSATSDEKEYHTGLSKVIQHYSLRAGGKHVMRDMELGISFIFTFDDGHIAARSSLACL